MRFLCCLLVATIVFSTVHAQNDKFVEIVVQDTVHVEGVEFTYMIMLLDEKYLSMMGLDSEMHLDKESIDKARLEMLVDNEGGKLVSSPDQNDFLINISSNSPDQDVVVTKFSSKSQLKEFVSKLRQFKNVNGVITDIKPAENIDYELVLLEKLMDSGRRKAHKIVSLMGSEVGGIIEISEYVENIKSYGLTEWNLNSAIGWTAYSPLSLISRADGLEKSTFITKSKTLRIRYRILDK